jgi:uncharacterized integral membrane protein
MQFLKTLFWVALAVVLVLFAHANWQAVTIELWGGLEVDIKLPVLVFGVFLIGFLPTFILYRARLWSLRRRLEAHERNAITNSTAPPSPPADPEESQIVQGADQRLSGQSTVAPAP